MECERASGRMTANVWTGLGVEQGLLQGCVLAPLLFNVLFAAVLRVAVERFSADADVVKDRVCTNKVREQKATR